MKNKNFKKNFKIAFVDQKGNIGGGQRFASQLLHNFSKYHNNVNIDYFGNPSVIRKFGFNKLKLRNVNIIEIESLKLREKGFMSIKNSEKIFKQIQDKYLHSIKSLNPYFSGNLKSELEKRLKNYDIVFFLWPYLIEPPNIKVKKIIILHDFMYKYYFGGFGSFNLRQINTQHKLMLKWTQNSDIIITSNFMKDELFKFYPKIQKKKSHVIRLGPLTELKKRKLKKNIIKKFKIKNKYILCPTVDKPHKNIYNLLKAYCELKKKYKEISLVFCGVGTELINGQILKNKIQINSSKKEVYGLGYVSDYELNCLIKHAELTINQSFYDAGNGSGLDAWLIGCPVAMSNIPPYIEHINKIGVKAEIFDPGNYRSILKKIIKILKMKKNEKDKMISISKRNIKKINWKFVVKNYYNLIEKII